MIHGDKVKGMVKRRQRNGKTEGKRRQRNGKRIQKDSKRKQWDASVQYTGAREGSIPHGEQDVALLYFYSDVNIFITFSQRV